MVIFNTFMLVKNECTIISWGTLHTYEDNVHFGNPDDGYNSFNPKYFMLKLLGPSRKKRKAELQLEKNYAWVNCSYSRMDPLQIRHIAKCVCSNLAHCQIWALKFEKCQN